MEEDEAARPGRKVRFCVRINLSEIKEKISSQISSLSVHVPKHVMIRRRLDHCCAKHVDDPRHTVRVAFGRREEVAVTKGEHNPHPLIFSG